MDISMKCVQNKLIIGHIHNTCPNNEHESKGRGKGVRRSLLNLTTDKSRGEILLYKTEDGNARLEVQLEQETIWLDAHQMGTLFERDRSVIVKHIGNIYKTGELLPDATCAKNAQVAADKKTRIMDLYNLDMIISVGYRVNSKRGTQFRIWATQVLKDHILKGYTINEKRLKEENKRLLELQQTVDLLGRIVEERQLAGQEAEGVPLQRGKI
jgi:hypothetical protein